MGIMRNLIQRKFNLSSRVCNKLDGAIAKNDARAKKARQGMKQGSLSQRAKAYFTFSYSWKAAAAERVVKVPFAVSRKLNGFFLK